MSLDTVRPRERVPGLACAECRRSKLKCDRVFPCESCRRRGCQELCPDGSTAGMNRLVATPAQNLKARILTMSSKIKELEKSLSDAYALHHDDVHPLLRAVLPEPTAEDVTGNSWESENKHPVETPSTLLISPDGHSTYHEEMGGGDIFQKIRVDGEPIVPPVISPVRLPNEIHKLSNAFPFGLRASEIKVSFTQFLPERERALYLADNHFKNSSWVFDPILEKDFFATVFNPCYDGKDHGDAELISTHGLSVLFVVLASGALRDDPSTPSLAEQYHILSRAAFSAGPITEGATCATVQALFLISRFVSMSEPSAVEEKWLLIGLCCRVSQTIGLQRDGAPWDLESSELSRRRFLFWELFSYDSWAGIAQGRPPALAILDTDCKFSDDVHAKILPSGKEEMSFHAWNHKFAASCLSTSVQHAFSTQAMSYDDLLILDKKIRTFPVPSYLQAPIETSERGRPWSPDPVRAMQQYAALCAKEYSHLYNHRTYFVNAIRQDPQNLNQNNYWASVLATYRAACRLISSLRGLYAMHPKESRRESSFWLGVVSSCIVFGALVVESPSCTLAPGALKELQGAVVFYEQGSGSCRVPGTLNTLKQLAERASLTFNAYKYALGVSNPENSNSSLSFPTSEVSPPPLSISPIGLGSDGQQFDHNAAVLGQENEISGITEDWTQSYYVGSGLTPPIGGAIPGQQDVIDAEASPIDHAEIWKTYMQSFILPVSSPQYETPCVGDEG